MEEAQQETGLRMGRLLSDMVDLNHAWPELAEFVYRKAQANPEWLASRGDEFDWLMVPTAPEMRPLRVTLPGNPLLRFRSEGDRNILAASLGMASPIDNPGEDVGESTRGNSEGRGLGNRGRTGNRGASETGRSLAPLAGSPNGGSAFGAEGPDPRLHAAAADYAASIGRQLKRRGEYVKINAARARRIAAAYEAMEHAPDDPTPRRCANDWTATPGATSRLSASSGCQPRTKSGNGLSPDSADRSSGNARVSN